MSLGEQKIQLAPKTIEKNKVTPLNRALLKYKFARIYLGQSIRRANRRDEDTLVGSSIGKQQ